MKTWLIADSGGTGTNWAYGNDKLLGRFTTSSLHPRNLKLFPDNEKENLKMLNKEFDFDEVLFYGAGMSSPENQQALRSFFDEIQVNSLIIGTDALLAGLACCGLDHGFVAILGTGSILIEMNNGQIVSRVGGLGPEEGDEGSGYYFGKLVRDYLIKSDEWKAGWAELFGSKEQFLERYPSSANPSEIAVLAKKLSNKDFVDFHCQNIDLFIETHLKQINSGSKVLNIVGSYGFYLEELIRERLKKTGWTLNKCIIDPMEDFIGFYFKKNSGL
jgi:N-acetylglucosamine kinase-like BadF-type ATPase